MPPVLVATDHPQENKAFSFEVEVDLRPELPTIDCESIEVTQETASAEVTDEEVEQRLNNIREREATFSDIPFARPAQDKDLVVISFSGTVDGVARDGMAAENQTLVLGQKQFLPEFEAGILGMETGTSKDIEVKFPDNYHAEDLNGKTAIFKITLHQIKQKNLPELNDDLAKAADPDAPTLLALRMKIREELKTQKEKAQKDKLKDLIGDALTAKYNFPVSQRQVASMAERLAEHTHHMMHQMGVEHEESEEHAKSLMEASLKKAERDIRLSYILEAIARAQKIEVTQDDLNARYAEVAKKSGLSVAQIKSHYASKEEGSEVPRVERLKLELQDEKSLDYALSRATIKIKGS